MDKSNNISVKSDSIIKGHMQPKVSIQALFIQNLNFIPNILTIENIDIDKCKNFIEKNFAEKIKSESEKKLYNPDNRKFEILEDLYILEDNIYIFLSCDVYSPQYNFLRIYYTATEKGQALEYGNQLRKLTIRKSLLNKFKLITHSRGNLVLKSLELKKAKIELANYYNEDLCELHPKMLKQLKEKNNSGLFLFYGKPGTGKSSYIKHLIGLIGKQIIFLSPGLAGRLELPEFTNLLIDNPGSILIIEDAEEILVTRESGRNSAISTLLNLSDGLLGESLGIQIICTFNTNITEIDLALLRKGRLKSYYEFHPLTIEKSNNLLKTINKNNSTEKPLTLSEIFHFNDPEVFNVKENQIGFVSH